jgi:COP9 signalosome complex subunit 6
VCVPSPHLHSICLKGISDKQVFPSLEFIGWYSVALKPTASHIALHEQVCFIPVYLPPILISHQFTNYSSTPLLLLLQPASGPISTSVNAQTLPFKAYEPTIEIRDRKSRSVFIEAAYNVETGEAERIAVDWTARGGGGGTSCKSG